MTSWLPARYPKYPANGGFAERLTITELLHRQGYAMGHFGKWHIGPELYDVVKDSGEHQNLAAQHPDIVKKLSAKLGAWQATLPKSYDRSDEGGK